ncbi:MAG: formyl transferase [Ferruginibacter sp.]|nr:formyl transferase [Ferruginibacter sp.]
MEHKTIVLLAVDCLPTRAVYHAVDKRFGVHKVILEEKESTKVFIKRRIKRLGFLKVAGQAIFQVLVVPFLNRSSADRVAQIIAENKLNTAPIPSEKIIQTLSINDAYVIEALQQMKPDLVIVNGTRIISKKVLAAVSCPFINMHVGITPMYRGVHGGYWALANNDAENCGVTIHLVDAGIDTGKVLYQQKISVSPEDNFSSYPVLQFAAGVSLILKAVEDALTNNLRPYQSIGGSKLWYHPTIGEYLVNRFSKRVK